ncbi:hypothetical protein EMIT0111MI5_40469 [Burkholderia sp. IT-111MI5]
MRLRRSGQPHVTTMRRYRMPAAPAGPIGHDALKWRLTIQLREPSDGLQSPRPARQPLHRRVLDPLRRSLQGLRPHGRRSVELGVPERRRKARGVGAHHARRHCDALPVRQAVNPSRIKKAA